MRWIFLGLLLLSCCSLLLGKLWGASTVDPTQNTFQRPVISSFSQCLLSITVQSMDKAIGNSNRTQTRDAPSSHQITMHLATETTHAVSPTEAVQSTEHVQTNYVSVQEAGDLAQAHETEEARPVHIQVPETDSHAVPPTEAVQSTEQVQPNGVGEQEAGNVAHAQPTEQAQAGYIQVPVTDYAQPTEQAQAVNIQVQVTDYAQPTEQAQPVHIQVPVTDYAQPTEQAQPVHIQVPVTDYAQPTEQAQPVHIQVPVTDYAQPTEQAQPVNIQVQDTDDAQPTEQGQGVHIQTRGFKRMNAMVDEALPPPVRKRAPFASEHKRALMSEHELADLEALEELHKNLPTQLTWTEEGWRQFLGSGMEVAGRATFNMAALQAAGVVPDILPRNPAQAMVQLFRAAGVGNMQALMALADRFTQGYCGEVEATDRALGLDRFLALHAQLPAAQMALADRFMPLPIFPVPTIQAQMALADRFMQGYGVEVNPTLGLYYMKAAALQLVAEIESEIELELRFAPPIAPPDLHERFMDAKYMSQHEAQNGDEVVSFDDDLATLGMPDAQRRMFDDDLATRGMPDAQRRMGYRRLMGQGMEMDLEGAWNDFEAAAAQGDEHAIFNLGYMAMKGLHVPENMTRAREYFEKATVKDLSYAHNGVGVMQWNGQGGFPANLTAAFISFEKGAAGNNSDSVYNMALMLSSGYGTDKNVTKAAELYELADVLGHWRAAYELAVILADGRGEEVPKDVERSVKLFRKFFRDRAQWNEGISAASKAMEEGEEFGALMHNIMIAEQGSERAAANAAFMLQRGLGYSGPGHQDMAANLFERAANQLCLPFSGYAFAARATPSANLPIRRNHPQPTGHMIFRADELSLTRRPNMSQVFHWYNKSVANNLTEGLFYLGWAHHQGVGTLPNNTRAKELYQQAIKQAGKDYVRGLAARAALVALSIEESIEPYAGTMH
eukprot:gene30619-35630_t